MPLPSGLANKLIQVEFPTNQYYKVKYDKTQIVLHHTVSGGGARGDISWWLQTTDRIATCVIIDRNGKIYQCYSSAYWAHHLGVKSSVFSKNGLPNKNVVLNQQSIGIELDSWGGLVKSSSGSWHNAVWNKTHRRYDPGPNKVTSVQQYSQPFRGFYGYEKYTKAQLQSLKELLTYWKGVYKKVPFNYNDKIWDINKDALRGKAGIYTHVSYRPDKSDCHPQPELVQLLKSL